MLEQPFPGNGEADIPCLRANPGWAAQGGTQGACRCSVLQGRAARLGLDSPLPSCVNAAVGLLQGHVARPLRRIPQHSQWLRELKGSVGTSTRGR